MDSNETSSVNSNNALCYKCENCDRVFYDNHIIYSENFNKIRIKPLNPQSILKMKISHNQDWFQNKILKDLEISIKDIIISFSIVVIAIILYFLLTGNLILLLISFIPIIYLLYRSFRLLRIQKKLLKNLITFKPNIEELNINLSQNKIFSFNPQLVVYKNALCFGCEEKLKRPDFIKYERLPNEILQ
ncbi:MAG: hypothetical protein ACW981_00900 [Candidatus Hodarchaeales archaeon]|jgi:hypothetical protein